jgi:hypothetical protein
LHATLGVAKRLAKADQQARALRGKRSAQ